MLKVILFDFNGVIINDEPIHLELIQEILLEENVSPSLTEFKQVCLGRSDRIGLKELLARRGRMISDEYLDRLIRRKAQRYRKRLEALSELPLYPQVKDILKEIGEKGFKIGLVTGAFRPEVEMILERGGLKDYFQVSVTGDDIKTSKPQPDGYLLAVERFNRFDFNLQLKPGECLAIEDSFAGIQAAKNAGMQVVGIANTYPFHFMQRLANWAIDYLSDLELERIEETLRRKMSQSAET